MYNRIWISLNNTILSRIILMIGSFFYEYIQNNVITHIPIWKVRWLYLNFILKKEINKTSFIAMGVYIYPSLNSFHVGSRSVINRNCILDIRGGLSIGSDVSVAPNAMIYTAGHRIHSSNFEYYTSPVEIEDKVWIGSAAQIMPGVKIGYGAVVLAGAVVTKDVPDFSIVGGIPATVLSVRNKELEYEFHYKEFFK